MIKKVVIICGITIIFQEVQLPPMSGRGRFVYGRNEYPVNINFYPSVLVIDGIESHGDMTPLSRVQKWPFYVYAASRVCFLAVNRSSVPHIELVLVMPVVPHLDKEVVLDAHNGGNFCW